MALSENRFQSTENQLKSIDGQNRRLEMLTAQVETLKGQNQAMQADGQRVLSAYQSENEQLRRQISERQAAAAPAPGPAALYEIGRAHGCTPVTNAQLVCRLLL